MPRTISIICGAIEEGERYGGLSQAAFLHHALRVVSDAALSQDHNMSWGWPILGIPDPGQPSRHSYAPNETSALCRYHNDMATAEADREKVISRPKKKKGGGKGDQEGKGADHK